MSNNPPPPNKNSIPEAHELTDDHQDLFDEFFSSSNYKPAGEESSKTTIRAWLSWCDDENISARDAKQSDVLRYLDNLDGRLAAQSLISRYNNLSIFYATLIPRNIIDENKRNPAEGIDIADEYDIKHDTTKQVSVIVRNNRSTEKAKQNLALSPEQMDTIAQHVNNPTVRNELMVRLGFECGLRAIEIKRLRVRDVDRDERHLTVDSAKITKEKDDLYFRDQWWSEDSKIDYLMYRWLVEKRPNVKTATDPSNIDKDEDEDEWNEYQNENLFLTHKKDFIRPTYYGRIVREAAKDAGLNQKLYTDENGKTRWLVSGHTPRISYITYLANHTPIKVPVLASLAGHKKIETTYGYVYTKDDTLEKNQKEYSPL